MGGGGGGERTYLVLEGLTVQADLVDEVSHLSRERGWLSLQRVENVTLCGRRLQFHSLTDSSVHDLPKNTRSVA